MTDAWLNALTRLLTCGLLVPGLAAGRAAAGLSEATHRSGDPVGQTLALPVVVVLTIFAVVTVVTAAAGVVLPWPEAAYVGSLLAALWVLLGTLGASALGGWSWSPGSVLGLTAPLAVMLCVTAGELRPPRSAAGSPG